MRWGSGFCEQIINPAVVPGPSPDGDEKSSSLSHFLSDGLESGEDEQLGSDDRCILGL